jgi:HD-like signal output (HDOD) protein
MIRVLFVDDDPIVLKGLQMRLSRSEKWEVHGVSNGPAALDLLAQKEFDVIVSDMRMPGMDGLQLLTLVRERYPQIVRLILTGHPGADTSEQKMMPIAQRVLNKPCDPAVLEEAVERCCALNRRVNDPAVLQILAGVTKLPALPKLYWEVVRELENPNADATSIGKVIEQDVGMTARVLQVANSAFFAPGRRLRHIREAVTFLGLLPLRSMALAMEMFNAMSDVVAPAGFSLAKLQAHSLRTGQIASGLLTDPEERQTAFSAGVLHDIGQMIMAVYLPERWIEARVRVQVRKERMIDAEFAVFGCTHAEIGAHLLGNRWGLPNALVEAVTFHHAPGQIGAGKFGPVGAVHVANALAHEEESAARSTAEAGEELLDHDYLRAAGIEGELANWRGKITALTAKQSAAQAA